MNKETLQKANELAKRILENERALNCFEYDIHWYARDENPELPIELKSTNPRLIIEHDDIEEGDGRTQTTIPIILSDFIINMIKDAVRKDLGKLKEEFNQL